MILAVNRRYGGIGLGLLTWEIPAPVSKGWDTGDEFRPFRSARDAAVTKAALVLDAASKIPAEVPGATVPLATGTSIFGTTGTTLQGILDQANAALGDAVQRIDTNWPWDGPFGRYGPRDHDLKVAMQDYVNALKRLGDEGKSQLDAMESAAKGAAKSAQQAAAAQAADRERARRVQEALARAAGKAGGGGATGTPLAISGGLNLPTWAKAILTVIVGGGAVYLILRKPKPA